jgi:hypothetical protein
MSVGRHLVDRAAEGREKGAPEFIAAVDRGKACASAAVISEFYG